MKDDATDHGTAHSPPASPAVDAPPPQHKDLGRHAARGASVTLVGQVARLVIQVGSVAVLARLLDPVDYGLIAIVLAIMGLGEILRDFGLSTGAVQAPSLSRQQRDQLFWLNSAIGAALTVVVFLLAPAVAAVFGQPALTPITQALAVTFLLSGAAAQYRADLNRAMRFKALVVVDVVSQAVGVIVAIALAVLRTGYWALVAQQLVVSLATLVILMVLARWLPGRPRRGVDIRSVVRFGHGMMASQIVGYLNSSVDTYTIALRLGPEPLGVYNRGFQLLMRPLNQLRSPSVTVALPVLARLHDDPRRTAEFLIKGQLCLGYPLLALLAYSAGAADPIIAVFLGPGWEQVVPVFALLALAGAFQTLSYVGSWIYLSRALTGELFKYSLVSLAIKVACVLVGSQWGIVGVAAGFAIAPALSWPLSLWWVSRLTPVPLRELWLGSMRILITAVVAGGSCLAVVVLASAWPALLQLVLALLAVAIGFALVALLWPAVRRDMTMVARLGRKAIRR